MKSKTEIIKEIKKNFENNPRSINPETGACYYNGPNGEHCAFAIYVAAENQWKLDSCEGAPASMVIKRLGIEIMKDEYQIEDTIFWNDIQAFHDHGGYWTETKNGNNILTKAGTKFYNYLLKTYR